LRCRTGNLADSACPIRGRRRFCNSTLGDGAHILIKDWPSDDGEEYVAAVKACVDAISGQIAPEQFREALLRAADEAGIAVLTVVHR
jgi:hypothetical protein